MFQAFLAVWTDCYSDWRSLWFPYRVLIVLTCMGLSWIGMGLAGLGVFHVQSAYSEWTRKKEFNIPFESLKHSYAPDDFIKAKCTFYNEPKQDSL